jgi:hypothetical protein
MIFLIHFDRRAAVLRDFRVYQDAERIRAQQERLALEISQLGATAREQEIVLLEAASEADIRKTHRRYFESLKELTATLPATELPS